MRGWTPLSELCKKYVVSIELLRDKLSLQAAVTFYSSFRCYILKILNNFGLQQLIQYLDFSKIQSNSWQGSITPGKKKKKAKV